MAQPEVHSVRYLGSRPRTYTDEWALVGQDGGQSIALGDGKTLFVFSDTLLAARTSAHPERSAPAAFRGQLGQQGVFLANCAGVSSSATLAEAWKHIGYYEDALRFPREILTPTLRERAQEIRFWPEHGVAVDGSVYLFYLGIQTVDASSIWGFRNAGSGLARLDPETGECERIEHRHDWRIWHSGAIDMHFGVQVLRDEEHCYIFSSVREGLHSHAMLARVRPGEIANPDAYEYLTSSKPSWSGSIDEVCDLGPCASDYSVSWNAHLGQYLMLLVDPFDKVLTMRTADAIWGPYSEPVRIIGVPHRPRTELVYLGFEHPRFTPDGGATVLVSYCQPRFLNNCLVALKFR